MLQQALQKIQNELAASPKDAYVQAVGAYLTDYVRNKPEHAAFILTEGKTIVGSLKMMEEEARKVKQGSIGVLTPEKGYAVVLGYFGVRADMPKPFEAVTILHSSIDDLL